MNAIRIGLVTAAALSALVGGAVHADDITFDPYQHMVSTRTRADVLAELEAAIRNGDVAAEHGEDIGSMRVAGRAPASTLTRAQARADVLAARRSGSLEVLHGEDSGSFHLARQSSGAQPDAARLARFAR